MTPDVSHEAFNRIPRPSGSLRIFVLPSWAPPNWAPLSWAPSSCTVNQLKGLESLNLLRMYTRPGEFCKYDRRQVLLGRAALSLCITLSGQGGQGEAEAV